MSKYFWGREEGMGCAMFSKSINQWCYGKNGSGKLPKSVMIGGKPCRYSDNTDIDQYSDGDSQVVIIGTCADATGMWPMGGIARHLVGLELPAFIEAIGNLCGVFAIFRVEHGAVAQIFGDATHMMPVYYGVTGEARGIVASCEDLIVDEGEKISDEAMDVLAGCYVLHTRELAGDMTVFREVKCLLPNHYLDVGALASTRYFPKEELVPAKDEAEINEIVDRSLEMCACVARQLASLMKFASPLTEGADSRVNCALLRTAIGDGDTIYYVIRNAAVTANPQIIPFIKSLAEKMGIGDFRVFPDEKVLGAEELANLKARHGRCRSWDARIWTYHPSIMGRAIVNGQVIGQIGQSYMRSWPTWMSGKRFMRIKMGNTSPVAYKEFSKWHDDARAGAMGYSMYDLWAWEIRCGRWNSNIISKNGILGIRDVNFYNCRRILQDWCRIPRNFRGMQIVHKKMLERLMPEVVNIPINPFISKSRHLPAFMNRIVPVVCQEVANYILARIRGRH